MGEWQVKPLLLKGVSSWDRHLVKLWTGTKWEWRKIRRYSYLPVGVLYGSGQFGPNEYKIFTDPNNQLVHSTNILLPINLFSRVHKVELNGWNMFHVLSFASSNEVFNIGGRATGVGTYRFIVGLTKKMSQSTDHALRIDANDSLWAVGDNTNGRLGDGTEITRSTQVQIGNAKWKNIYAGNSCSVGIQENGSAWMWGYIPIAHFLNEDIPTTALEPTLLSTEKWKICIGGHDTILGIKEDGTLWGCGFNTYGELGDGTKNPNYTLTQIGTAKWKSIHYYMYSVFGIQEDGTLWTWGFNQYGQLGDGTTVDKLVPTKIGTTKWKVVKGSLATLGIQEDDSLWAWGVNGGTYGNGTTENSAVPILISSEKWLDVATCWGMVSLAVKFTEYV